MPVWATSLSGKVREGLDHRALKDSGVLESVKAIESLSLWLADIGCSFTGYEKQTYSKLIKIIELDYI